MKSFFKIAVLIGFGLIFSCNNKKLVSEKVSNFLSSETIKSIPKKGELINFSKYRNIPVFVKLNNGTLIKTKTEVLYYLYQKKYQKSIKNFNDFLFKSFNQDIQFSLFEFEKYDYENFVLEYETEKYYLNENLNNFFSKYLLNEDKVLYVNGKEMKNLQQYQTVIYILFINNYYATIDDYSGRTYIKEWEFR